VPQSLANESWISLCRRVARAEGPVAWRWGAARDFTGKWGLLSLVVSVSEQVQPFHHRYGSVIVAGEELSPRTAASRLRRGIVARKARLPKSVAFDPRQQVSPLWIYSGENYRFVPSGWPCLLVTATAGQSGSVDLQQPLNAVGQPFFPSFAAALGQLVFGVSPAELQTGQAAQALVRIPDRRARLAAVDVHEGAVHATVQSSKPDEFGPFLLRAIWRREPESVEWERQDYALSGSETVVLQTNGVPAEIVVVLVDDAGREIDRRAWNEQFGRPAEPQGSLEAVVARWLTEGEHEQLEYKQTLKESATRVSFAETVAAFANGAGGAVLVGVDDEGRAVGYAAAKARDQVANVLADLVEEPPTVELHEVQIDECPVVVVIVAASAPHRKPHQVRGRVMLRALGTTRQATPAELRQLLS
jgi:hypothetical protein